MRLPISRLSEREPIPVFDLHKEESDIDAGLVPDHSAAFTWFALATMAASTPSRSSTRKRSSR